jgi:hypothetical protein
MQKGGTGAGKKQTGSNPFKALPVVYITDQLFVSTTN